MKKQAKKTKKELQQEIDRLSAIIQDERNRRKQEFNKYEFLRDL